MGVEDYKDMRTMLQSSFNGEDSNNFRGTSDDRRNRIGGVVFVTEFD
jgi:hypothetical protein